MYHKYYIYQIYISPKPQYIQNIPQYTSIYTEIYIVFKSSLRLITINPLGKQDFLVS